MPDPAAAAMAESHEIAKLRAAMAWLSTCPVWQKSTAAELALEKALEVLTRLDERITELEKGKS